MHQKHGFTLIEILIGITVLAIVFAVGYNALQPDIQRRALQNSAETVEYVMSRAQVLAMGDGGYVGVCFVEEINSFYAQIYRPQLSGVVPGDDTCDSNDVLMTKYKLKPYVKLCTICDPKIANNKSVFFNGNGFAVDETGSKANFEICLRNVRMADGVCAREIEVLGSGVIDKVDLGSPGDLSTVQANVGDCGC